MKSSKNFLCALIFGCAIIHIDLALAQQPSSPPNVPKKITDPNRKIPNDQNENKRFVDGQIEKQYQPQTSPKESPKQKLKN
jgi:hypothetical protein